MTKWWWHCVECGDTMAQRSHFAAAVADRDAHIAANHPNAHFPYWALSISRYTFP